MLFFIEFDRTFPVSARGGVIAIPLSEIEVDVAPENQLRELKKRFVHRLFTENMPEEVDERAFCLIVKVLMDGCEDNALFYVVGDLLRHVVCDENRVGREVFIFDIPAEIERFAACDEYSVGLYPLLYVDVVKLPVHDVGGVLHVIRADNVQPVFLCRPVKSLRCHAVDLPFSLAGEKHDVFRFAFPQTVGYEFRGKTARNSRIVIGDGQPTDPRNVGLEEDKVRIVPVVTVEKHGFLRVDESADHKPVKAAEPLERIFKFGDGF